MSRTCLRNVLKKSRKFPGNFQKFPETCRKFPGNVQGSSKRFPGKFHKVCWKSYWESYWSDMHIPMDKHQDSVHRVAECSSAWGGLDDGHRQGILRNPPRSTKRSDMDAWRQPQRAIMSSKALLPKGYLGDGPILKIQQINLRRTNGCPKLEVLWDVRETRGRVLHLLFMGRRSCVFQGSFLFLKILGFWMITSSKRTLYISKCSPVLSTDNSGTVPHRYAFEGWCFILKSDCEYSTLNCNHILKSLPHSRTHRIWMPLSGRRITRVPDHVSRNFENFRVHCESLHMLPGSFLKQHWDPPRCIQRMPTKYVWKEAPPSGILAWKYEKTKV